ncbi:MAG: hypothetical protein CL677_07705 [Bdellovibrionaceae bacterium]|mgnify:CR=1 FL=1|nr:hypothetical protein [Pseudobdellovibrionaceae bacterium]|tara:strand:- start:31669 stop:32190 length:522 start_codon:yes stop_codon:yes gene_type:complete
MLNLNCLLLIGLSIVLSGCSTDSLEGAISQDCSDLSGAYTITSRLCDNVETLDMDASINFSSGTSSATHIQGGDDCSQVLTWETTLTSSSVGLTGDGNISCLANDVSVSSCSGTAVACADSVSIDGVDNSFESCSIDASNVIAERTVTAALVSSTMSACSAGETERLTLVPEE